MLWLAAIASGLWALQEYAAAAGAVGRAPSMWPSATPLRHDSALPTLIMFAHPQCPCTRASIGELAVLMSRCSDRVKAQVLFLRPAGFDEEWVRSGLWHDSAQIPGVEVGYDEEGHEAQRFGAATSGHVVLYDVEGRLLFSGGITKARGHSGENAGRALIQSILRDGAGPMSGATVYGCALRSPGQACCQ